ncbi:MAG: HAD family phosphatase [Tyzzerella sp.]|nr:HAD family phosphatase [Tyzzerella sp.]
MLTNIDAVIFDIDGTLVDSMHVWTDIDDIFLEKYHLVEPENFHEGMEGKSYSETAQYFLDLFPELPHTKEELEAEWHEMAFEIYTKELQLKKGAYDFILDMHKAGMKLGIATSNSRDLAEGLLMNTGVWQYLDAVWTSDEAKAGKPAPDVYLKVAESLSVKPERCLVFEDVPNGILAGKNAGMKVCAVEDPFSNPQITRKKELADYYIQDYDDIKNNTYEEL